MSNRGITRDIPLCWLRHADDDRQLHDGETVEPSRSTSTSSGTAMHCPALRTTTKVRSPEGIDIYAKASRSSTKTATLIDPDKAEVIREVLGDKLEAIDYDAILPRRKPTTSTWTKPWKPSP